MTRHAAPTHPTTPNPNNQLVNETSPYLLQHKDNPVNWRAWNEAALAEAQASDKPILLSIGYAACHWCHVMAHESFEDPTIAELMNELFVNIKIDREERPDLDQIYQQALALLGQQGGWPLTMFLTPEGRPFWGGTYFPKEPRYGRPGFGDVLKALAEAYRGDKAKVAQNVEGLAQAMLRLATPQAGGEIALETLDRIAERLLQEVDLVRGGIGGAPKFPQGPVLNLLWRACLRTGAPGNRDGRYREAVLLSLTRMIQGGIYDHLGGGLARYATDADWLVPHFEKMLYDNAELLALLAETWIDTGEPLFEARAAEIVAWLTREMLAEPDAQGRRAFAASLDADSEGVEGKFYVWDEAEIDAVLGTEAPFFKHVYGVSSDGNWEGVNILNRGHQMGLLPPAEEERLGRARAKLLEHRATRIRPGWDDKVLVDWNGLMIASLALASQVFARPDWLALAESAFAFIDANMRDGSGRLRHAWRQGRLAHPATLDDHANLARAALSLHQATGKAAFLDAARKIVADLDRHYWDKEAGGYFFTADDTGDVIVRTKSANDNATPSGNGTMLEVLTRLHHLTGDDFHERRADALAAAFAGEIQRNFFPLATYLGGIDFRLRATAVVIVGARDAADTQALLSALLAHSQAHTILQVVADTSGFPQTHPVSGKTQVNQRATAYVCRLQTCSAPITEAAELAARLSRNTDLS